MQSFITRFNNSLKSSNLKESKQILAKIPGEPDGVYLEVLNTLALVSDDTAWELLFFLSNIHFRTPDMKEKLLQLIVDRAHLSFQFLTILYRSGEKKKILESAPLMKHVLANETDTGILVETILAVGKYRITSLMDEVSEYIYFDNNELKAHAVQALERIGSPRALNFLEDAAATIKCDQNILDTISALKKVLASDKKSLTCRANTPKKTDLYRALESRNLDTRFNALTELEAINNNCTDMLKKNLLSENHDRVINTLGIIERTIPETMVAPLFSLVAEKKIPNTIKFAAYEALGAFPGLELPASTLNDLDDPNLHVRMAVINLLDKSPTDLVMAGIKSRIESGKKEGEMLAKTILDVGAGQIIDALMISDTFSYIASNYLLKQAALSPLQVYIKILMNRGLKTTARKFNFALEKKLTTKHPTALVLGRSKTVLAFYEKLLHQQGYAPLLFLSCQDAFENAAGAAPSLIVSDLFLNGSTFVEFALQIRKLYPPKELAFVISTLQQDFIGNRLGKVCTDIGVSEIYGFPAEASQIPSHC